MPSNKISTAAGLVNMIVDSGRGVKEGTYAIDTHMHC